MPLHRGNSPASEPALSLRSTNGCTSKHQAQQQPRRSPATIGERADRSEDISPKRVERSEAQPRQPGTTPASDATPRDRSGTGAASAHPTLRNNRSPDGHASKPPPPGTARTTGEGLTCRARACRSPRGNGEYRTPLAPAGRRLQEDTPGGKEISARESAEPDSIRGSPQPPCPMAVPTLRARQQTMTPPPSAPEAGFPPEDCNLRALSDIPPESHTNHGAKSAPRSTQDTKPETAPVPPAP